MPIRVVVDDEVAEAIRSQAQPLVDSFNSVLRRILGLAFTQQPPMFYQVEEIGHEQWDAEGREDQMMEAQTPPPGGVRTKRPTRRSPHAKSATLRAKKGSILDEKAYWRPVLEVLSQSPAGAAPASEVIQEVGERLRDLLTPLDLENTSSGDIRWHKRVMFARLRLKDAGLVERDSPRGVWQISQLGRTALSDGLPGEMGRRAHEGEQA